MPGRDDFPKDIFEDNPMDGLDAHDVYKKLRWGNEPDEVFEFTGPEDMATLGTLARIDVGDEEWEWDEAEAPFLAVGVDSNKLFIVPRDAHGNPTDVPKSGYEALGQVERVDYYSDKGDDEAYYYHEHEPPYPTATVHKGSGVMVIEPAEQEDGSRSYAVDEEGVIG